MGTGCVREGQLRVQLCSLAGCGHTAWTVQRGQRQKEFLELSGKIQMAVTDTCRCEPSPGGILSPLSDPALINANIGEPTMES